MSEKLSAASLARQFMERHSWNRDKAIKAAMAITNGDPDLAREVQLAGWEQLIGHVASERRDVLMRGASMQPVASRGDNTLALRSVMSRSFLETYDVLGIPLGKCTPDDLRRSISSRKSTIDTHQLRIDFETAVLRRCKLGKTVAQCWNDTDLENLAQNHNVRRQAA